jgi:hypothetical protein
MKKIISTIVLSVLIALTPVKDVFAALTADSFGPAFDSYTGWKTNKPDETHAAVLWPQAIIDCDEDTDYIYTSQNDTADRIGFNIQKNAPNPAALPSDLSMTSSSVQGAIIYMCAGWARAAAKDAQLGAIVTITNIKDGGMFTTPIKWLDLKTVKTYDQDWLPNNTFDWWFGAGPKITPQSTAYVTYIFKNPTCASSYFIIKDTMLDLLYENGK